MYIPYLCIKKEIWNIHLGINEQINTIIKI